MFELAKRNLRLYFRDKTSVFFSLLAVFIVLGLYIFFLGDTLKSSFAGVPDVDLLIGSWVMAGILSVAAVTTTLGAFGTMVDDRSKKITKDFGASPLRRFDIAGGYIASSFLIGLIMSLITLVLAQVYILTLGGPVLAFPAMAKLLGYILLSVFASSAMMLFIVSFFTAPMLLPLPARSSAPSLGSSPASTSPSAACQALCRRSSSSSPSPMPLPSCGRCCWRGPWPPPLPARPALMWRNSIRPWASPTILGRPR